MKVLFVYPRFDRHADSHPELRECVPLDEYLGSPSLGIASLAAVTPADVELELRDDRLEPADADTDADLVALSFFTPAAARALELADHFRALGKPVVAGGIFPTQLPEAVSPHVDAVVRGEGEPVWADVLRDAASGALRPVYRAEEPADLSALPAPRMSLHFDLECEEFRPDDYPLQLARGCSLSCEACVLPSTMGAQSRPFPFDHVLAQLDTLEKAGKHACLTEDTSWFPGRPRKQLERLLDHLIERGQSAAVSYIGISMPLLLTAPLRLLTKARSAGITMFYLVGGFDPITRGAFTGSDPRALDRAERAIARAHEVGIEPYTSFLLGNDDDDEGTVDRMLEFCERSRIRKAEFAVATPYPGTPRWHQLVAEDRLLHRDWSRYNDANAVFRPAQMTADQLTAGYLRLWRDFYEGKEHLADLSHYERTIQF